MSALTPDDLPIRDDLRGRHAYGAPQLDVPVRLNTNENSHPLPEVVATAVVEAVAREAVDLNRYPDRDARLLRGDLAAYLRRTTNLPIQTEQVWAANGSNEVLMELLQAFGGPGRTAIGFTPSYSMHPILATTTGTAWVDGARGVDLTLDETSVAQQVAAVGEHGADVVFLTSPDNPSGTSLDLAVVEAAYEATSGVVIVDEAYAEFARPGTRSAMALLPGRERLVVTRTLSKAFALAGARVGYLAADPAVVEALLLVRLPYHLSSLTQAAARAGLAHAETLLATVEDVKAQRDRIVEQVRELGLVPVPSDANFVLVGGLSDAPALWRALVGRGVLVRDVGITGHLRVTAGTREETTAFLTALREALTEGDGGVEGASASAPVSPASATLAP